MYDMSVAAVIAFAYMQLEHIPFSEAHLQECAGGRFLGDVKSLG